MLTVLIVTAAKQEKVVIPFQDDQENVTRWVVDQEFRADQERLGIPQGKNSHVIVTT